MSKGHSSGVTKGMLVITPGNPVHRRGVQALDNRSGSGAESHTAFCFHVSVASFHLKPFLSFSFSP